MQEIFKRRSIRKFSSRKIEREKIDKLLSAAMMAPSAGDQREWRFLVVTEDKILQKLSLASPHSGWVAKAAVSIVILADVKGIRHPDYWQQDLSAASENLLLEAVNQGLGAVWLGMAPQKSRMDNISKLFSLPEHIKPFCVIALGYPEDGDEYKQQNRFDSTMVYFNKYI